MQDLNSIFEKSYELDRHVPGLHRLLLILQEAAGDHASKLGFGYESLQEKGFFWALIRQKLIMDTWPKGEEPVTIKTWSLPILRVQAIREFELYEGLQRIGACSTTWVILDSKTRRPKAIENTERLFRPRTDYSVGFIAGKIVMPDRMDSLKTHLVDQGDLDSNNHVNNTNYARWILEARSDVVKPQIREYEVNFLAEALLGDQIELLSNADEDNPSEVVFNGHRIKDDKHIFAARMVV